MSADSLADRRPLLSLTLAELESRIAAHGGKPFHAKVLRREVLERGALDYDEITGLSKRVREGLAETTPILAGRELERVEAPDGTTKLLLSFERPAGADGESAAPNATVETVHIPHHAASSGKGATLCVSTQIGCPVACPFCASGKAGLVRNLEAHEIVEQFLRGRALGPLSRSVVMGIGEPLLNYDALRDALDCVHDELGKPGLGARRITVSTVGFPDRVHRIATTKPRFQLAVSLHTPFDEQRDELVPAMAGTPIEDVLGAADAWFDATGREVTYEIVLLAGVTDTPDHAYRLADRLRGRRCTVNLIPFNPVAGSDFGRPRAEDVDHFRDALIDCGLVATVRWSRGLESDAACGQLRIRSLK